MSPRATHARDARTEPLHGTPGPAAQRARAGCTRGRPGTPCGRGLSAARPGTFEGSTQAPEVGGGSLHAGDARLCLGK